MFGFDVRWWALSVLRAFCRRVVVRILVVITGKFSHYVNLLF
jgi:hypothetical protein